MADLLDAIAAAVGTTILSDLYQRAVVRERIPYALRVIPRGAYSLKAWREAARYILRDNALDPATEREARELLESSLRYNRKN